MPFRLKQSARELDCSVRNGANFYQANNFSSSHSLNSLCDLEASDEVKLQLSSFVPRRLREEILSTHGKLVPESLLAAVLVLDISGFSVLCERSTAEGTAGCENFALTVSEYFKHLVTTIESTGGDIEAFAGDALIVVFYVLPSQNLAGPHFSTSLEEAVHKALSCASLAHRKYGTFKPFPQDEMTLTLHSAITAGRLWGLEAEGTASRRIEAFVVGQPMAELSAALDQAKKGSIVVGPSAWSKVTPRWRGRPLEHGCFVIQTGRSGSFRRRPSSGALTHGVADGFALGSTALREPDASFRRGLHGRRAQQDRDCTPSLPWRAAGPGATPLDGQAVPEGSPQQQQPLAAAACSDGGALEHEQLGERIVKYLPKIVVQMCVGGMMDLLAQNRLISTLFVVKKVDCGDLLSNILKPQALQKQLGAVIDIAEHHWGGTTRQITFDDKGLTAIFVFGLPGSLHSEDHVPRSVCAALDILSMLRYDGDDDGWTAGVSNGYCFCGPIGDLQRRCEYVVMGDSVVTAARMAGLARKRGYPILCSEAVNEGIGTDFAKHNITMQLVGKALLKGKSAESRLYLPKRRLSFEVSPRHKTKLHEIELQGRKGDCQAIYKMISSALMPGSRYRFVVLESSEGMGKALVMDCVIQHLAVDETLGCRVVHVCASSVDSSVPFCTCNRILSKFSAILGDSKRMPNLMSEDGYDGSDLPSILKPYEALLQDVQHLRRGLKADALKSIYADAILKHVQLQPTVVAIDNGHWLDEYSWGVLAGDELAVGGKSPYAFFLTSRPRLHYSKRNATRYQWLCSHPSTWQYELGRLDDAVIVRIALEIFKAKSLSSQLLEVITGTSQGVPLYAHELAAELHNTGCVDVDANGECDFVGDADGGHRRLPASLQSMIQAKLDHLPGTVSMVIQCASVMGMKFTSYQVHQLLSTMVSSPIDSSSVREKLSLLAQLRMIRQVANQSGWNSSEVWEFCFLLQREVAYEMLLHWSRKKLHKVAARLCQEEISKSGVELMSMEHARMQGMLVNHWLCAVQGTRQSRKSSTCRYDDTLTVDDLKQAWDALARHFDLVYKHGLGSADTLEDYSVSAIEISRRIPPGDGGLQLELQSLASQMTLLMHHSMSDTKSNLEMINHNMDLCGQMDERISQLLERIGDPELASLELGTEPSLESECRPFDLAFARVSCRFFPNGCVPSRSHIRQMERMASSPDATAAMTSYAGHYHSLLCFLHGDYSQAAAAARRSYEDWCFAGRFQIRNGYGVPHGPHVVSLWYASEMLSSGCLNGPAEAAWLREMDSSTAISRHVGRICMAYAEALWEPMTSKRVGRHVDSVSSSLQAIASSDGPRWPSQTLLLAKALTVLRELGKIAALSDQHDVSWAVRLSSLLDAAEQTPPLIRVVPIAARLFIREGFKDATNVSRALSLWGNSPPSRRLESCKSGLKRCISIWERQLKSDGDVLFMEAMLVYCRAMHKVLLGFSSPRVMHLSLESIIAELLRAESLASDSEQPLVLSAGLPAVVALCRILTIDSVRASRFFSSFSCRGHQVTVPCELSFQCIIPRSKTQVLTTGSQGAMQWAANALDRFLQILTHHELAHEDASWQRCGSAAEIWDSESLWEAKMLHSEIVARMDSKNHVQPDGRTAGRTVWDSALGPGITVLPRKHNSSENNCGDIQGKSRSLVRKLLACMCRPAGKSNSRISYQCS